MFFVTGQRSHCARWNVDFAIHSGLSTLRPNRPAFAAFVSLIRAVRSRSDLLRLAPLGGRTPWADALRFCAGLVELSRHWRCWQREAADWSAPAGSRFVQFASLAGHLLTAAPVPRFLVKAWLDEPSAATRQYQTWYKHLGLGHEVRGLRLPLRFTRRMAEAFRAAPDDLTVPQALRWAQVRGLGGDDRSARILASTRLGEDLSRDEYWSEVIRFLLRHPRLILEEAAPVVEYLHAWKSTSEAVPPPTLPDQTLGFFLHEVRTWWKAHRRQLQPAPLRWRPIAVRPYRFVDPGRHAWSYRMWTIEELLDSHRLDAEGEALHHCVGAYSSDCVDRTSSIWSMQCHGSRTAQHIATIEIDPSKREIVTALGRCNRRISRESRTILDQWARRERLAVASWI